MPSVVGSPVRSLAGFQSSPRGSLAPAFEDPLPLGVRLYSLVNAGDRWVTDWVDDIEFRSVVPGGFASATITLRVPRNMAALPHPDPLGFSRLTELFRRIQVVDLRSQEIAWEGRVEDPARQVEPDTWQIGALGSMVAATDIQRPVFYVDSDAANWRDNGYFMKTGGISVGPTQPWVNNRDSTGTLISIERADNTLLWVAGDTIAGYAYGWRWDSHGYDQAIARFTTTQDATGPNSTEEPNFSMVVGIAENKEVDVTGFENSGAQTKTNTIGTDFTDTNTRYIVLGARRDSGAANYAITDATLSMKLNWSGMVVVGMRQDRYGNHLTTAASYPGDYVTVPQVVEDVIGRFLNGGWYELGVNTPNPGSVRPTDVYIDASSTTQILHLIYPNGATAADILGDLATQVQTNAYWAIWESRWHASTPNTAFGGDAGFRFEWATWPANWGYLASSQDGFEGQPNGDVINFVSQRYQDVNDLNAWHVDTAWTTGSGMAPELLEGGFTRSVTLNKNDPTDGTTANNLATSYVASSTVLNAGTLTVRRPIQLYDAGTTSNSGAGRMLDPWMIRPGKLVRIVDLPPRAATLDMSHGATPPNTALGGAIFKVVATTYTSSDNTCRLELDQPARWNTATQIAKSGAPTTIRIQ